MPQKVAVSISPYLAAHGQHAVSTRSAHGQQTGSARSAQSAHSKHAVNTPSAHCRRVDEPVACTQQPYTEGPMAVKPVFLDSPRPRPVSPLAAGAAKQTNSKPRRKPRGRAMFRVRQHGNHSIPRCLVPGYGLRTAGRRWQKARWRGRRLLAKKSGNAFRVGSFLDSARSSARTEGPHGAYVQMSGRNRSGPHWGEAERLTARTCLHHHVTELDVDEEPSVMT